MRRSKFSEQQRITILKAIEAGQTAVTFTVNTAVNSSSICNRWRLISCMEAADIRHLRELEEKTGASSTCMPSCRGTSRRPVRSNPCRRREEKRPDVIERNLAAWMALYRS